jgi:hypothetical protein
MIALYIFLGVIAGSHLGVWILLMTSHQTTPSKSPVMQAAESAAKKVEGWSNAKKAYADRITGAAQTTPPSKD